MNTEFTNIHGTVSPYGLHGSKVLWFVCWFWRQIKCLFVCLLNFLSSFFTFFFPHVFFFTYWLVYFLTYLTTSFRIDPFHFQARGRRRWPNLALFSKWPILCWVGRKNLNSISMAEWGLTQVMSGVEGAGLGASFGVCLREAFQSWANTEKMLYNESR